MIFKGKKALISTISLLAATVLGYFGISYDGADDNGDAVSGRVTRVIDGDIYDWLHGDNTIVRIRMLATGEELRG